MEIEQEDEAVEDGETFPEGGDEGDVSWGGHFRAESGVGWMRWDGECV